ncbi:hypothetical protein V8E51_007310 [Hyaloscypha variabilis]
MSLRGLFQRRPKHHTKATAAASTSAHTSSSTPTTTSTSQAFPSGIKLLHNSEHSVVDIIFVHGLTGDREKTWRAKNSDTPWPQSLLPSKVSNARILTFGYDACVTDWRGMVSKNRIANHAMNLLTSIATYREDDDTNNRPLIFVCHSLGGLVCEDALSAARQRPEQHLRDILDYTRGIVFLGTPHHGSGLANWAHLLARWMGLLTQTNPQILAVLESDSEILARVQDGFHTMVRARIQEMLKPIEITCFYEELPLPGIGVVVPSHSAILPGYIPIGIRSNHMDMTKFESADDPGFIAVAGEIRRWIKAFVVPKEASAIDTETSEQEGQVRQQHATQSAFLPSNTAVTFSGDRNQGFQLGQNYGRVSNNFVLQPKPTSPPPTPSSTVPFRQDPDFVDRGIFPEMKQKCALPAARIALVGSGGVGKSQLAIEYSYHIRDESPETWVFWVYASTRARFEESYKIIAERAKITGWNSMEVDILQLVSNWLCDPVNGQWLIILDNADYFNILFNRDSDHSRAEAIRPLSDYLPQSPNGSIIITSRNRDLAFRLIGRDSDIIKVTPMDQNHALTLLHRKLHGTLIENDCAELVQALDFYPLAITQAAAYINQRAPRITISRYLQDLQSSDKDRASLLQKDIGDPRRDGRASNSIITTWQISFEYIRKENGSAARLLSLMSFFDRQRIPESLLIDRYQDETDNDATFEDDIATLTGYSLVTLGVDGNEFEMHRLVQFSTKKWLEHHNELAHWTETFLDIMDMSFPSAPYENWTTCQQLFPHAEMTSLSFPINDDCVRQLASVLSKAAWYSTLNGRYDTAEEMNRQALAGREKALGQEHPNTLTSVSNLALVLQCQGKYELAEEMNRRALAGREKVLGLEHPDTLTSVSNLAIILQCQGKYELAEEMNRRALAGREKVLGLEHPDTLTSVSNLAIILRYQGKYELAEEMNRRALAGSEKALGQEHPDTLTSVGNLALVLQCQGKYELAEEMNRRALAGSEKALGLEHPDTLTSVGNLATVLQDQGKYELAEEMNRRALAGREKALGLEHPDTLTSVGNLALVLQDQGKYELAEEMNRRALAGREKALGLEHPETLASVYCLAYLLQEREQYQEALVFYQRACTGYEVALGQDHPTTRACSKHYSSLLSTSHRR